MAMKPDLSIIFQRRFAEKLQETNKANDQLTSLLLEVSKILGDINDSYMEKKASKSTLICRSSLDKFFEEEDKYQETLTKFTKTLFDEPSFEEQPHLKKFSLLLHGIPTDSDQYRHLQSESRRLYEARRLAWEAEIASEVSRSRAEAQVEELQASLLRLKTAINVDPAMALDTPIVTEKEHKAILSRVHSLRAHVERIRRCEIPALLDDVCGRLSVDIESVHVRLQEARHRFFIHRQEQLLRWLMKQRQWATVLVMCHETEGRNLKMMLRLLLRLKKECDQLKEKMLPPIFDGRVDREIPNLSEPEVQKAVQALGKERLVPTPSEISNTAVSTDLEEKEEQNKALNEFEENVGELYTLLFPDGSGGPQLSYGEVQEMLNETKNHVKALSLLASSCAKKVESEN